MSSPPNMTGEDANALLADLRCFAAAVRKLDAEGNTTKVELWAAKHAADRIERLDTLLSNAGFLPSDWAHGGPTPRL